MRKKLLTLAVATVAASSLLTGCGGSSSNDKKAASDENITAVSREDGSGTRGAFIELFGIEQKDKDGNKVDKTTSSVQITNSTSVMMTTVAENKAAIGYISLGSLNDTVKAVKIDGAEASVDTVKDGSYKIVRPFNIVTKDKLSKQAQDFENYIMSADGQKIIQDNGYIKADEKAPAYKSNGAKGKVVVGGSSSVTPVMEKLKEAYAKANKDVTVEVQQSDSTTGVTNAIEGTCDIGMASRDLADSEAKKGVKATVIAKDGIAVIVNKDSKVDELTSAQVKDIYTGKTTKIMHVVFLLAACASILAVILICAFLFVNGIPTIGKIGLGNFVLGKIWMPKSGIFGIFPMIIGSIYVTAGAILVGVPVGILAAIYMAKFCNEKVYKIVKPAVDLLAGIPSVVYGFFGMVVLVPAFRNIFGNGNCVFTASILLGIMILPTIIGVSESAIRAVPDSYYEGSLGLGASHERSVFFAVLPAAKSGILAGIVLGIGRAIGETMAVVMVAGNQAIIPDGMFSGVRTLTSNIVLEMGYATDLHREALIATAVVLFVFILMINLCFAVLKSKEER